MTMASDVKFLSGFCRSVGKVASIAAISILLVACGDKSQRITNNSDEPAWVNDNSAAKKEANSIAVGVGSAKLLDNNMNYALNQASMQARIQIAQMVSARVEQVIKDMSQSDGLKISDSSLQAAKQKVSATLQQTEVVKKWIDKESKPQTLYALVSMDKDAFDRALKAGSQVLDIDADKAKKLSDTVESLLKD